MDKETIESRLKRLRKTLGFSQAEFAKQLDMAQNSYSQIETGKNPITDKNVSLICLKFGVSEEWLRSGLGEMLDTSQSFNVCKQELFSIFDQLSPLAQDLLVGYAEKILSDEKALRGSAEAVKNN